MKNSKNSTFIKDSILFWGIIVIALTAEGWADFIIGLFA